MTILDIVIYFALLGTLLVLSLTLLTWYLWPPLRRKSHCAWCWKALHLMQWYPRHWSSTICRHHDQQLRAQSGTRRARRLAAAMRPPAEVQA
jgi:hypothetical protein